MRKIDLYMPTGADIDRLRKADDHSIIAAGPWIQGRNEVPHRVVLRYSEPDYIVHLQCIPESGQRPYFYSGTYFHESNGDSSLDAAWLRFEERSRHYMAIKPEGPAHDLLNRVTK